jgi:hypothetical protein
VQKKFAMLIIYFLFFALFFVEFYQAIHFEIILHYVERGKKLNAFALVECGVGVFIA